ncbi:tetratricopeptide repeat protein 36 homolog [Lucilia sericata]|uniref:tetratricopeptide repeat protein 36 homolog n=1 Tax=Lucilia sericata TaxID=13632 RepID=UPI0018A82CAF|nr:tetratricopeptide repeat protein 36 homolog [Lucilia sericata]XP_037827230.1 tetratricopeptide repeat protein 36 homolog [Lucilia sericata]XP_037827232.1 tetratricopeptide repeat protein 36 homolog [Lucilia sericata]XP_037827327.1 tetratricopeptide repeat protein 36 homolog [Lucilia sericata]
MPLTKSCLSAHDQQVLESIFNPLELTSSLEAQLINPDSTEPLVDQDEALGCEVEILKKSKQLEIEAVKLAEEEKLEEALEKFKESLELTPKRASIYNNRAQALRLAGKDEAAFDDLNQALENCLNQAKSKCHALCQRGVLYRKQNKLDEARQDFEEAAKMGSKFAKQQLVEINPFAALCNQMLRQAFQQLEK